MACAGVLALPWGLPPAGRPSPLPSRLPGQPAPLVRAASSEARFGRHGLLGDGAAVQALCTRWDIRPAPFMNK